MPAAAAGQFVETATQRPLFPHSHATSVFIPTSQLLTPDSHIRSVIITLPHAGRRRWPVRRDGHATPSFPPFSRHKCLHSDFSTSDSRLPYPRRDIQGEALVRLFSDANTFYTVLSRSSLREDSLQWFFIRTRSVSSDGLHALEWFFSCAFFLPSWYLYCFPSHCWRSSPPVRQT